jgi:hypothetical protein
MTTVLCTLFEDHYHHGVAALGNSLMAAGYTGQLWAGYRGELPAWATQSAGFDPATGHLHLRGGLAICFVALDTPLHLNYYKPTFMRSVLQSHAKGAQGVVYFDADVVVNCEWCDIGIWFKGGIAMVEDVNWSLPERHPKRLMWSHWFAPLGYPPVRSLGRCYNAGFVGVPRECMAFLETWEALCQLVWSHNDEFNDIKAGTAPSLFHSTDQDAMNYALMHHEMPLNTAGPEAMDFTPGGYYLSHAITTPKPWAGKHLLQALCGRPPTAATRAYYRHAGGPIQTHSGATMAWRRLSLALAAVLGRFYRRT